MDERKRLEVGNQKSDVGSRRLNNKNGEEQKLRRLEEKRTEIRGLHNNNRSLENQKAESFLINYGCYRFSGGFIANSSNNQHPSIRGWWQAFLFSEFF
jgi:hypothetical protein